LQLLSKRRAHHVVRIQMMRFSRNGGRTTWQTSK